MKEIILPTELMAFFILNMFGHDSALHDFTLSSELGKSRVLEVLRSNTPISPGSEIGTWSGKGGGDEDGGDKGGGDKALNDATTNVFNNTVGPTLYKCLKNTGFFDHTRNGTLRSDSFIIVEPKLALGPVFTGSNINMVNMGIAPGFIYLPEGTYSPFEFKVIGRGTIDTNGFTSDIIYQHHTEPLAIQINHVGNSFNCIINRNDVYTTYNLLSSDQNLIPHVNAIIAMNPDVSDAFMSNAVSTSITDYVDYIQLLLDGEESRYTFILTDYDAFGCMNDDETNNVKILIDGGKKFLVDTITVFWQAFHGIQLSTFMMNHVPNILAEIDKIQGMFALIYKSILCAVGTAVKANLYYCTPPPIYDLNDLNNCYLANKLKLEMFVYEYMVSVMKFDATNANKLKIMCNAVIQHINTIMQGTTVPDNIATFVNFLQIVSDTLIDKETDEKEIQEQKENEVVYVNNVNTKYNNESYIHVLTNLPIIAANPATLTTDNLRLLIELVQKTLIILFNDHNPQDPDYTIILTNAVGSDNVETIKGFLSSPDAVDQVQVDAELLQTVFLDLINRLDSDQLEKLINELKKPENEQRFGEIMFGGGGQSGGAKKKPEYLFVFSDVVDFFTQLTKQNRLTKMKAKFKELFDKTNVLPAFYTDLIIQPNLTNALNWTIDFNTVFLGFFQNPSNLAITDIIRSIDSGVIFPQIPSNIIDDLTLDDVLTERFSLIKQEEQINALINLKKLEDNLLQAPSTPSVIFQSIITIITGLNLPGIFVEPDEGSDIFWRFEQGYIYLLKCVMLYAVLFFKALNGSPSGCETLATNGFIGTGTAICPNPDDYQLNNFLLLFFSCTTRYIELLQKITELMSTGSVLSGAQKICTGYALGCVLTSVMTEMNPIISSFKNSALLNIETTAINRILTKKANLSTILQNAVFGDNDTKLYNKFINWVSIGNKFQRVDNTIFSHKENISGKLGESLINENIKWDKALLADIIEQYGGNRKFYINNAVNAPSALGKLGRGYFCPAASIADNQPTCSSKASAEANEGFEIGIMDFVIHDGRKFGQQTGSPPKMIYRVRVVPSPDKSWCKIGAYLEINNNVLINVADQDILDGVTNWPGDAHPPIIVPLNSTRGDIIPMDAKTCLKNIFVTIDSNAFKIYNNAGFQSLIDDLDKSHTLELRRLILESSFVKGLGDFLQEASGFVDNSGYEDTTVITIPDSQFIRNPNEGRLQLNNDRPSSVRAILLVLYGKGDINPNVIAGFLTEMKDKKKIPKSKYALAGRLTSGGGRNKKKTNVSKRNKITRRKKMKTRVNKSSKLQKKLKVRKTHKIKNKY